MRHWRVIGLDLDESEIPVEGGKIVNGMLVFSRALSPDEIVKVQQFILPRVRPYV